MVASGVRRSWDTAPSRSRRTWSTASSSSDRKAWPAAGPVPGPGRRGWRRCAAGRGRPPTPAGPRRASIPTGRPAADRATARSPTVTPAPCRQVLEARVGSKLAPLLGRHGFAGRGHDFELPAAGSSSGYPGHFEHGLDGVDDRLQQLTRRNGPRPAARRDRRASGPRRPAAGPRPGRPAKLRHDLGDQQHHHHVDAEGHPVLGGCRPSACSRAG